MIYILAPFGLAFALFVVFLIVSIFLKDPGRPFRMFGAPPLRDGSEFRDQSSEETEDQEPGARSQESEEIDEKQIV